MRTYATIALTAMIFGLAAAQPPRRDDVEDPKAKPKKPIDIESFPDPKAKDKAKPPDAPTEGPGVQPGSGVLVIGVRALPELMSPTKARTEAERWACDLMFEGLMRPAVADAGTVFEPGLAISSPGIEAGGRAFTIDPAARWTDAARSPVVAHDVLTTMEKLRAAGRADLLGDAYSESQRRVRLTLRSPHPDPPSLFTFKVVPAGSHDDEAFARAPIGSGPFIMQKDLVTEGGRKYLIFRSNPEYSHRVNRGHLPQLQEVRFLAGADPLNDLRRGIVDFVLEERTAALATPATAGDPSKLDSGLGGAGRVFTRPTRRIIYLEANALKNALGGDRGQNLRRAIAFGIQRNAVLDTVWRAGAGPVHRPLTGPFPADTWCADPEATALDDESLAKAELRDVQLPDKPLVFVFPTSEPLAGPSCERIREQLKNIGIGVETRGLNDEDYRRALAEKSFDLAYRNFDYRDDWFDPAPLFAVQPPGPRLESLLAQCTGRCEFAALRDARRRLQRDFRETMPFIPLWSPDVHLIVRRGVEPFPNGERLDPHAPLAGIDRWRVNR